MALRRRLSFQPDILEWVTTQRTPVSILRNEHRKLEKGFAAYFRDGVAFCREVRAPKKEKTAEEKSEAAKNSMKSMAQYYESEDLIKRMKWKRVTWDDDADYSTFSKRIMDNDSMFKNAAAFSFMSIHVIKDPITSDLVKIPAASEKVAPLSLTSWLLKERDPQDVPPYSPRNSVVRRSAFKVDWASGSVKILDTASAQEVLTFLSTVAPRLQAVQIKMEEQQTRQREDIDKVKVRVGAVVKFNDFETSFWDDPNRLSNPNYVDPDEVEKFLQGMLKAAFLYRWFLKGQQLRIVSTGRPYFADLEKKEIHVPANFAEFNWIKAHTRFESLESVFNSCRRFWWVWLSLFTILLGDVELL